MDCYLHEGIKILYRVSMAILQLFYKYSTSNNSIWAQEINNHGVDVALMNFCRQMPVIDLTPMVLILFRFMLSLFTRNQYCVVLPPKFINNLHCKIWNKI